MKKKARIRVGNRFIGAGEPVFVIAEIGINHNGSLATAKKIVEGAMFAGCDAVKFQKRTPELCVPQGQWYVERETPWGHIPYIEYRHKVEFNTEQFAEIDRFCRERGILWFASCWDEEAVDFIEQFDPPLYKAASASLTDHDLLRRMKATGKPLMISTGMSEMHEIIDALDAIGSQNLLVAHSTSAYPCPAEELNLRILHTLQRMLPHTPIGYSGHEVGLATTWAAVALGATFVERHVTLDRAMWGSDQAASVEIIGMHRLVRNIRDIERALGDGVKRVYASEIAARKKLRRVPGRTQPAMDGEYLELSPLKMQSGGSRTAKALTLGSELEYTD
ncbi:MAG: N-acetylneuraminate synthase family protein [Chloroflexia bacterium]|nr:N-acetylneuraminate synthase family protein [Chloroflexia bacterium]